MFNWITELIEARLIYLERKRELNNCNSCETLRHQLALCHDEKKLLLEKLLTSDNETQTVNETHDFLPLGNTRHQSFAVRRQMLESEDRERARLLKGRKQTTEELEASLDLTNQSKLESESKNGL